MSIKGSPHANLQRAIATGNPLLVRAAVAEVPGPIALSDALAICLVLLRAEPERYDGAAVRLHARLALELPLRELAHSQIALAALSGLRADDPAPAAHALAELLDGLGFDTLRGRLDDWSP